jgi:hypothetical protein
MSSSVAVATVSVARTGRQDGPREDDLGARDGVRREEISEMRFRSRRGVVIAKKKN